VADRIPVNDLHGKVALVTGASSGLGAHFSRTLAAAGARVALAARRVDRLEALAAELGGGARGFAMDVTDVAGVRAAVDAVERDCGPIDILVNNSGVTVTSRIVDVEAADWDFILDTNARGAFFVAQAVARRMLARDTQGRIINVASTAGLKPLSMIGVYSISKAAVVHMTRAMAVEWARHGIAVNAICPGYIAGGSARRRIWMACC
jgi:NAD(P)-dependent dehydrogenase (short-subunit alcohol dehydrogenase family)